MRVLLLLLVGLFATLTSACTFPFNDNRLTNSSLVEDRVAELQASGQLGGDGGKGWMTIIGGGATPNKAVWPNDPKNVNLVYIHYCFATRRDYHELHQIGDQFVNFDCTKLIGYWEAKKKVESEPRWRGFTIDEVCKSQYLGTTRDLNWGVPHEYSLDMGQNEDRHDYVPTKGSQYDHDSIMQYYSASAAGYPNGAVQDMPLVRWKNGRPSDGSGPDSSNAQRIPRPTKISDLDKAAIQFLYP
ncbi:uncharacterized protein J4E88_010590 [Alternaria novae-zelandiae]|uniref:uncharacterized protein n=1 Tax=Alternaria novae-zelandiae TaxID=430562 RepID=UPI0020C59D33|nr:uncharacterized protein J4E88_010590 [Alternaria novae-zelandiae]KAI4665142.1 hypothetical protein J4E88_010590 [Alternaria novae-zelandiae]